MNHPWEGGLCINNKEEEKDKIVNMFVSFCYNKLGSQESDVNIGWKDIGKPLMVMSTLNKSSQQLSRWVAWGGTPCLKATCGVVNGFL